MLEDPCGGKTHQYFHVRVLQPPVISPAQVTVRPCRGASEVPVSMWVVDPDTPVEKLALSVDAVQPAGVGVWGVGIRRQPWSSGQVGAAELAVRVAPWV
ncbi:MAG: hypothetical protein NZ924_00005, partial [Candidatus Bipolaricaulota bacterium]|nr:hypothetical protein [Candidatus Bipolaricaulota bacterium]MDW8151306.1 hypothetical protein [Candidatus Bipolaricaulota bacterium]